MLLSWEPTVKDTLIYPKKALLCQHSLLQPIAGAALPDAWICMVLLPWFSNPHHHVGKRFSPCFTDGQDPGLRTYITHPGSHSKPWHGLEQASPVSTPLTREGRIAPCQGLPCILWDAYSISSLCPLDANSTLPWP